MASDDRKDEIIDDLLSFDNWHDSRSSDPGDPITLKYCFITELPVKNGTLFHTMQNQCFNCAPLVIARLMVDVETPLGIWRSLPLPTPTPQYCEKQLRHGPHSQVGVDSRIGVPFHSPPGNDI